MRQQPSSTKTTPYDPARGIALMLCGTLSFALMGVCGKLAMSRLPEMEVVFFRCAVNALLLTPYLLWRRISLIGSRPGLMMLRGICGLGALCCNFYALAHLPMANANLLNQTSALFVALLACIFLGEKVTARAALCLAAGFLGVWLIVKPAAEGFNPAAVIGLLSGMLAALVYVAIRKLHETESFLTIVFTFSAYGTIGSALLAGSAFSAPDPPTLVLMIGAGAAGSCGQIFMTYSFKFGPASLIAPFLYSGALFGLLFDLLVWQAIPDAWSGMGMTLLIVAGISLARARDGDPPGG